MNYSFNICLPARSQQELWLYGTQLRQDALIQEAYELVEANEYDILLSLFDNHNFPDHVWHHPIRRSHNKERRIIRATTQLIEATPPFEITFDEITYSSYLIYGTKGPGNEAFSRLSQELNAALARLGLKYMTHTDRQPSVTLALYHLPSNRQPPETLPYYTGLKFRFIADTVTFVCGMTAAEAGTEQPVEVVLKRFRLGKKSSRPQKEGVQ